MGQTINNIIERLRQVHHQKPWYGPGLKESFKGYDVSRLSDSSISGKSIIDIAAHIEQWRQFALAKLRGDVAFDIELNTLEDWPTTTDITWEFICTALDNSFDELCKELGEKDDSILEAKVPGKEYDFRFLIEGVILHDVYHLGQMNLLYATLLKQKQHAN